MALNDVIARLSVVLGLDTAAFTTGAGRVRREATGLEKSFGKLKRVGQAVAGAFVATGVVEIANAFREAGKAAIESAGGIGEQAKALGVSTDALQQFRFMATQTGLDLEQVDNALGQFSKRLGAAELKGKGPFVTALEQIGLTLDDLKGKSETDQIALIADGIAKAGSEAQRSALQVQFFGKSGQTMATLLGEGSAGIKAYADEAKRLGVVLSEEDIAKADEVADKLAKLNFVIEAQKNKKLLENAEAIAQFEQELGNLKLGAIKAVGDIQSFVDRFNAEMVRLRPFGGKGLLPGLWDEFEKFTARLNALPGQASAALQRLYNGAKTWLQDKLGATMDWVGRKAKWVGDKFYELYDRVVGHSYVPDMVDGIAAEMARLDQVMVDPADRTTKKTAQSFRQLAGEVQGILDRLFPSIADAQRYAAEAATLAAGIKDPVARESALRALRREEAGLPTETLTGDSPLSDDLVEAGTRPLAEFGDRIDDLADRLANLRGRATETTVRIAKSFKDMADETLQAIGRVGEAIKGGGFLGILEAVIGLGMQLGSVGAFGKTIATRINSIPGRASGGPVLAGRPYLVGERGPELVVPRQSATVVPNHALGAGGVQRVEIVDTTGLFRFRVGEQIVEASPGIAGRGAQMAANGAARSRKWSLAAA